MPLDPRAWLADIVAACDLLIEFTRGETFSDYAADPLLRSAVERQFEIAGEALRVALQHQPEFAVNITDAHAIIAFRNQLSHAYSAVDHATVRNATPSVFHQRHIGRVLRSSCNSRGRRPTSSRRGKPRSGRCSPLWPGDLRNDGGSVSAAGTDGSEA
jgi:uncharacterized protein with HEPN domain